MKKTLLSILAGLTVVGSAFALPSPGDRKALCEKHPDKYVWVEKTQACIPINPCESTSSEIRDIYCNPVWVVDEDALDLVINRYVEKTLKTSIKTMAADAKFSEHVRTIFVKTQDGGYFAVYADLENARSERGVIESAIQSAFWAYGCDRNQLVNTSDKVGYTCDNKNFNDAVCRDVADFASLMSGEIIQYKYNGSCTLYFE